MRRSDRPAEWSPKLVIYLNGNDNSPASLSIHRGFTACKWTREVPDDGGHAWEALALPADLGAGERPAHIDQPQRASR